MPPRTMRTTSLLLQHRIHGAEAIVAFEQTDVRHRRKRRALDSPSAQAEEIAHRDVARHHQPQSRGHKERPAPVRGTSSLCVEHETRFELAFPSRPTTSHTRCSLSAPPSVGNDKTHSRKRGSPNSCDDVGHAAQGVDARLCVSARAGSDLTQREQWRIGISTDL